MSCLICDVHNGTEPFWPMPRGKQLVMLFQIRAWGWWRLLGLGAKGELDVPPRHEYVHYTNMLQSVTSCLYSVSVVYTCIHYTHCTRDHISWFCSVHDSTWLYVPIPCTYTETEKGNIYVAATNIPGAGVCKMPCEQRTELWTYRSESWFPKIHTDHAWLCIDFVSLKMRF